MRKLILGINNLSKVTWFVSSAARFKIEVGLTMSSVVLNNEILP